MTSSLEPVVAAVAAYVVLGEALQPTRVARGALILAGITTLQVHGS